MNMVPGVELVFRPNGFGPKQTVKLIAKYDASHWRVQDIKTRYFYLALARELFFPS